MNKKRVASIAISAALLTAIALKLDIKSAINSIGTIALSTLALALMINIIGSVVLNTAQIYQQLQTHENPANRLMLFLRLLRIDFIIRFYSLVMPTAATAVVRWYLFMKIGINHTLSGLAVITNKILNSLYIILFSIIALPGIVAAHKLSGWPVFFATACLIFAAIALVASIFAIEGRQASTLVARLAYTAKKIPMNFFKERRRTLFISANTLKKKQRKSNRDLKNISIIFFWPLLSFLLVAQSQQIILYGLGLELSLTEALFFRAATLLALMIPFSFAGIGFRELGAIGILNGVYGYPVELALACSLVLFLFQLIISAIGFVLSIAEPPASRLEKGVQT
jgi:uncharacterized membrane protein YbhN (UPF0104 family)|tara:strand:+ start:8606 stop:9625 length:1020 start_codon:yes stop_codon:yes gene_type:complete